MNRPATLGMIWGMTLILALCLGVAGGIVLDQFLIQRRQANTASMSVPQGDTANFKLMLQAWQIIKSNYVDQKSATSQDLTYGAIDGMATALGDTGHSRFETPEEVKQEQNYTQGSFEGIGAEVETKDGNTVIVAPIDNSPAQKAGILAGDVIQKVDGTDVTSMALSDVVNRIIGPAGTKVTLTIYRPSTGETKTFTLTRAKITLQNVTWIMVPGTTIAHVRIIAFSQNVTKDLQAALTQINQQHATGIILDLRNNGGGLLDEAIGVASQFLSSGNVLETRDATGKITNTPVRSGGLATKIPMVVLTNAGTASASEIVTGALQDAGRAKVIGEKTFGTGTVLNTFPLSDGSALLLATEEWLTPKGRVIWHNGLTPDITVSLPASVNPLTPEAERQMSAAQINSSQDTQLLKALQVLAKPATLTPAGQTSWINGFSLPVEVPLVLDAAEAGPVLWVEELWAPV